MLDGRSYEHHAHHRALPAFAGTYAALAAKEAARQAKRKRKAAPRPVDALELHPLLARRAGGLLQVAEAASSPITMALSKGTRAIVMPPHEQKRGVAAIVGVLRAKGVELKLTESGTTYALGSRVTVDVHRLIEPASPLLHAHLQGSALRCELKRSEKQAPEAATLLVGLPRPASSTSAASWRRNEQAPQIGHWGPKGGR